MPVMQRATEEVCESIASQVDAIIRERKMSYAQVAVLAGVCENTVGRVMTLKNTRLSVLVQIAEGLGCQFVVTLTPRNP